MPRLTSERGAALLFTALALIPLLSISALALDIGRSYREQSRLQSAADAAATAGAADLDTSAAAGRDTAADIAYDNLDIADAPTGYGCGGDPGSSRCYDYDDIQVKVTSPYTVGPHSSAEKIRVEVCIDLDTIVAQVFGTSSVNVCGRATARLQTGSGSGGGPCGLCLLDPAGTTFSSTGDGSLSVNNSSIMINSNDSDAAKNSHSDATITSTGTGAGINIVGGWSEPEPGTFSPTPTTGATPITDPLAALPTPVVGGPDYGDVSVSGSQDRNLQPGIYNKITSSSSGTIFLNPGIYVITREIKLSKAPGAGETSLKGDNVMIYLACENYPDPCEPGEDGGNLSSSGGATMSLTGRTAADTTYQGMVVFADRENDNELKLTGSSGSGMSGTVYAKSMTVSLTGPSGLTTFNSVIVAGDLKKTGSSTIALNIDTSVNSPVFAPAGGSLSLIG